MIFTKEYSKLSKPVFTTIRKNTRMYQLGCISKVRTPKQRFRAKVVARRSIKKSEITEEIARADADCSRTELIAKLEHWYGLDFDDFVLLKLAKDLMRKIKCPTCGRTLKHVSITKSSRGEEHDWHELTCPVHGLTYSGERHALKRYLEMR